jgi:hypothetical protein
MAIAVMAVLTVGVMRILRVEGLYPETMTWIREADGCGAGAVGWRAVARGEYFPRGASGFREGWVREDMRPRRRGICGRR